jgi:hypothetical protein
MIFHPNFYRLTQLHRQLDDAERREARRRGADPFRRCARRSFARSR